HGVPPVAPRVPAGPIVAETAGRTAENRTYQDLLTNSHQEALFEHYATGQLARIELDGTVTPLCEPAILGDVAPAPDGEHLLVERLKGPWSYVVPVGRFARDVEIWNSRGVGLAHIADLPVADDVPIGGVSRGPRGIAWRADRPATL